MVSVSLREKLFALHKFEICTKLKNPEKGDKKTDDFVPTLKKILIYRRKCSNMSCHIVLCYAMPCYAMPCHAIAYYVMTCDGKPYNTISSCYTMQLLKTLSTNLQTAICSYELIVYTF